MNVLVVLATFLAAGVEWVEALTIVLAVGLVKGWRSAFLGMAIALIALVALIVGFGLAITSHVSIAAARTVVGIFLLLFGLKWLYKAILRSSGLRSLHDEAKTFRKPWRCSNTPAATPSHWTAPESPRRVAFFSRD